MSRSFSIVVLAMALAVANVSAAALLEPVVRSNDDFKGFTGRKCKCIPVSDEFAKCPVPIKGEPIWCKLKTCGPSYKCVGEEHSTKLWCAEKKSPGRYKCVKSDVHIINDVTKCFCRFEERLALTNVPVMEEDMELDME